MDGFIKVAAAVLTLTMLSACAVIPFQKEAEVKEQEDDEVYEVKMRDDYTDLAKKMFYDLTFMCKQLEGRQYGLYDCISKKEFYALQQAAADKLNDLSEADYYFELRRIIASIGVAHTTLNLNYTGTFPVSYTHLEAISAGLKYLGYSVFGAGLGLLGIFFINHFAATLAFVPGGSLVPEPVSYPHLVIS